MNERIKKLRKELDLTQQEFAEQIGTTANVLTNYETGRRNPSASVINNICKTFGVNEEWLRDGTGEMFVKQGKDEQIEKFINETLQDEEDSFRRRLIAALAALDPDGWDALEKFIDSIPRKKEPEPVPTPEPKPTIEQRVEAYRQYLLLQEEAEEKSAG